jgi:monoamine oxidase
MAVKEYDVLILGAGAAGLAAAAGIAAKGRHSALIVDARDRIGGRIWTLRPQSLPVPVELGAEFIHGPLPSTFGLLKEARTIALDAREQHWFDTGGRLARLDDAFFQEIRRFLIRSGVQRRRDVSFAELLVTAARHGLSPRARLFSRMMVEGFDAADPVKVSGQTIAEEWRAGGPTDASQFRPRDGYAPLMEALRARLDGSKVQLQLATVLETVRWRRGAVEIKGRFLGEPFRATAAKAIVTLPLGVLQQRDAEPGAVRFLPAVKPWQSPLQNLVSGPVMKVALHFREAFWEHLAKGRYGDASFFHSPRAAFPTFWAPLPMRAPLLVGWAGGPKADALAGLRESEVVQRALESLSEVLNVPRRGRRSPETLLEGAWHHDWQQDPFARGAYSYVTTGGAKARSALAKPVDGTLFYAGEAADEENAGTVEGALASGAQAARKV